MTYSLLLALALPSCAHHHTRFLLAWEPGAVYNQPWYVLPFRLQDHWTDQNWADLSVSRPVAEELAHHLEVTTGVRPSSMQLQNDLACAHIGPGWRITLPTQEHREVEALLCCDPQDHLCVLFGNPHELASLSWFRDQVPEPPIGGEPVVSTAKWTRRRNKQLLIEGDRPE